MGFQGEHVAYGLIVASYRRRMGVIAVGAGDGAAPVPPVAVRGPHPPPARRGRAGAAGAAAGGAAGGGAGGGVRGAHAGDGPCPRSRWMFLR